MYVQIFRIHPLSTEDILSQEVREKCDVFRDYLFVCYRAFVHQDPVLRPVSIYNIIHKRSILTVRRTKCSSWNGKEMDP